MAEAKAEGIRKGAGRMERQIRNLDELLDGALTERFNQEMDRVMANVFDPNTDAKAKRQIQIIIDIAPNEWRDAAEFKVTLKTKTVPADAITQTVFLYQDDDGKVVATERIRQIPGQIGIDGEVQRLPKVLEFGNTKSEVE